MQQFLLEYLSKSIMNLKNNKLLREKNMNESKIFYCLEPNLESKIFEDQNPI